MPFRKPPPKKTGRAYYYRMRTPEKRFALLARLAAILALVVVAVLIVAFGTAILLRPAHESEPGGTTTASAQLPGVEPATVSDAAPGETRDCAACPPLTMVPGGTYVMGTGAPTASDGVDPGIIAASESPAHGVTLRRFALQRTEVTRGQFAVFVKETGHQSAGCKVFDGGAWVLDRGKNWRDPGFFQDDEHPVVCVSAADAKAYLKWLSEKSGVRFRLPSESEWEYAARAGVHGAYAWGKDATAACVQANVADASLLARQQGRDISLFFACDGGFPFTAPVGKHTANAFGLADMIGNVREITADCWNPDYDGAPTNGAARADGNCNAVAARGAGWADPPPNTRIARRVRTGIDERRSDQGFRIARDDAGLTP
ncbi:MAG: formylglycine-generating enzyme family protein [Sphingomonadales bacterium]